MKVTLTQGQINALAAMVELGQQDRVHYLSAYAAENEESPEQISAGHAEVTLAQEAMAAIISASAPATEEHPVDEGAATSLLTVSADFHVSGDPDDIREPIERAIADLLEEASNDGSFSAPGVGASFLSAEVTSVYAHTED